MATKRKPSALSDRAKEEARKLVGKWKKNEVNPYAMFKSYPNRTGSADLITLSRHGVLTNSGLPKAGILYEFKSCGLVDIKQHYSADGRTIKVEIFLLETLREAVENNFLEPPKIYIPEPNLQNMRPLIAELRIMLTDLNVMDEELRRRFDVCEQTPTAEHLNELLPLASYKVMALFTAVGGAEAAVMRFHDFVKQMTNLW